MVQSNGLTMSHRDCFIKFLQTKALRRMDRYRLRNAPKDRQRKLLLPLSYGVSSLVLLHIISSLLERQRSTGQKRTAFDLHVLNVEPFTWTESKSPPVVGRLDRVREAYPGNAYTEIPLHSICRYDEDIKCLFRNGIPSVSGTSDEETLNMFRASFSTPTARADVDGILLRRLIVAFAKSEDCDGILWGDSDSRLAAKTLSHVAKGRGASLVWDVCDGMSPWDIYFNFPLRDLYKTELELFASYAMPALESVVQRDTHDYENMSNRNMAIEDLMSQYVLTQGAKYPGVMANIVRTVDKLKTPALEGGQACVLCRAPADAKLGSNPDGESAGEISEQGNKRQKLPTCYGCMRTLMDRRMPGVSLG